VICFPQGALSAKCLLIWLNADLQDGGSIPAAQ